MISASVLEVRGYLPRPASCKPRLALASGKAANGWRWQKTVHPWDSWIAHNRYATPYRPLLDSKCSAVHFVILECQRDSSPKNSVIIYSPSSSSKPVCISLFWTQRKIFWRQFVTRLFWGTIDFHRRKTITMEVNGAHKTALFPTFFKISSIVFCRTKTFIQVWNYLRVSKWQKFHFWLNYPFKLCLVISVKVTQK